MDRDTPAPPRHVAVLTLGGTIASVGASPEATTIYGLDAARDPVRELAASLGAAAAVTLEAVAHLPSHDLPIGTVLGLARRIAAIRSEGAADGIVITHGTDTLEETAYLLDLLLPPGPPVVLTGAARPSSALSADGPLNLLNAVRVAALPAAAGRGVLVCLNDRIAAARFVAKAHSSAPDAFRAAEQGFLGAVTGEEILFFEAPPVAGARPLFDIRDERAPPSVEIVHCHLGMTPSLLEACLAAGAAGIVFAATGNGSLPAALRPALERAAAAGVALVRSTRVGAGVVSAGTIDGELGTIPAGHLSPQKARLLLMLALRETRDRERIAALFRRA